MVKKKCSITTRARISRKYNVHRNRACLINKSDVIEYSCHAKLLRSDYLPDKPSANPA